MAEFQEVIVVGGGAIGAACARELARAGRSVLVIDRGRGTGEAWTAAGGMLAPQIEAHTEDPLFDLGLAGRNRYTELAPALQETTGIDIGLWQEGIAQVAQTEDSVESLKSKVAWQRQQGHLCDWLAADEVATRWPWMGPTHGALWAPEEGALNPVPLVEALLADAQAAGARMVHDTATRLERRGDRIIGVVGKEIYHSDAVVIAAGAWSGKLDGLPRPISVEPVRGQMAAVPWPEMIEPFIMYGADGYIIAREGEALLGSTMENAGFEAEVTSAGLASIFSAATSLCPGLAKQEVRRTWAGLRPVTPDGLPIVGREPSVEGLWLATGHGRNGILLAAITGLLIAEMISGDSTTIEDLDALKALDPVRFWRW